MSASKTVSTPTIQVRPYFPAEPDGNYHCVIMGYNHQSISGAYGFSEEEAIAKATARLRQYHAEICASCELSDEQEDEPKYYRYIWRKKDEIEAVLKLIENSPAQ